MIAFLTTSDTELWQSLAANLKAEISGARVITEPLPVKELEKLLNNSSGYLSLREVDSAIFFYRQLEHEMACVSRHEIDVEDTADDWKSRSERLLKLYAQNRSKVKLVNIDHLLDHLGVICQAEGAKEIDLVSIELADLLSLDHSAVDLINKFGKLKSIQNIPEHHLLIGSHYVSTHPVMQQLNRQIYASSIPFAEDYEINIDLNRTLKEWGSAVDESTQNEWEQERELLALQISQIQEELEFYFLEKNRIEESAKKAQELQQRINRLCMNRLIHYQEQARNGIGKNGPVRN